MIILNPFLPNFSILYTLKSSESLLANLSELINSCPSEISRNAGAMCQICLKITRYQNNATGDGVVLVFLLLTLNIFHTLF